MRLPLIPPSKLSPEQRPLYEDMKKGIETSFREFKAIGKDGALIGPWNPWLQFPKFGGPVWQLVKALSSSPALPKTVREVALLVTGARFHAGYEIYEHVLVAELRGLSDEKISTIVAGQRPADLTRKLLLTISPQLLSGGHRCPGFVTRELSMRSGRRPLPS